MRSTSSSAAMTTETRSHRGGSSKGSGALQVIRRAPGPAEANPRRYYTRRRRLELTLGCVVPILFLVLWQVASASNVINPQFFPAPLSLWSTMISMIQSGQLQTNLWASMERVLLGFPLGVITGVAAGLALGMSRTIRAALDPLLVALYVVPKLALLPLLLLIFGTGDLPLVLLIAMTVFFFMWISTMAAILSVEEAYQEAARSFGANRRQLFRHVLFPASLPQIFSGLRLSAGTAILVVVGIEFVEGTKGIGVLIWNCWTLFLAKPMNVGIVTVAVVGVVFTRIIDLIGRAVTPWAGHKDEPKGYY